MNDVVWWCSIEFQTKSNSYWLPLFFGNIDKDSANAQFEIYKDAIKAVGYTITRRSEPVLYQCGAKPFDYYKRCFDSYMNGVLVELTVDHFVMKDMVDLFDPDSVEDFAPVDNCDLETVKSFAEQKKIPVRLFSDFTGVKDSLAIEITHKD